MQAAGLEGVQQGVIRDLGEERRYAAICWHAGKPPHHHYILAPSPPKPPQGRPRAQARQGTIVEGRHAEIATLRRGHPRSRLADWMACLYRFVQGFWCWLHVSP
ncbi:hypothetical protein GOP47_0018847 [Adiantum capillus-veneris]|uniref:Uncharacterized protein n=1 Tax=Adiantum capillus-veneris TaxID=13818 RepID=A0A9D4UDY7_ADICA|nr:hypothetical protein GOP47_0027460 [Adiantum capillus-veneris]KAI5066223.1 hypothetical protein GOP47_0018847 [Adiantum capillus-veneris]